MTQQLIQEKVYILKTQKSLDSFGLKDSPILYYTHLDNRKTEHTQMIEKQLQKNFIIQPFPFSIDGNNHTKLKSKTSELWKLHSKP
jgi:phage-related protein